MPNKVSSKKGAKTNQLKNTVLIPEQLDKPIPLVIGGLLGIVIAYIVGSRSIDTGSYWEYLFTLIFVIISVRLLIRSVRRI